MLVRVFFICKLDKVVCLPRKGIDSPIHTLQRENNYLRGKGYKPHCSVGTADSTPWVRTEQFSFLSNSSTLSLPPCTRGLTPPHYHIVSSAPSHSRTGKQFTKTCARTHSLLLHETLVSGLQKRDTLPNKFPISFPSLWRYFNPNLKRFPISIYVSRLSPVRFSQGIFQRESLFTKNRNS